LIRRPFVFMIAVRGSPPLLIELGLDRADVAAGAVAADPSGAWTVMGFDDVGAPRQRGVAVVCRFGDAATDRTRLMHSSISTLRCT